MFVGKVTALQKVPTDYYCEEISPIDEQICSLLAERKKISNDNPGFPPLEAISGWCQTYDLNEQIVYGIFHSLYYADDFAGFIEPSGFLKFVPILKTVEENQVLYTITHMKQYDNASVVFVEVENRKSDPNTYFGNARLELTIAAEYKCRTSGGSGHEKGIMHYFVVTPPLPDDVSQVPFRLTIKPFQDFHEIQRFPREEVTVTFTTGDESGNKIVIE